MATIQYLGMILKALIHTSQNFEAYIVFSDIILSECISMTSITG